MKIKCAATGKHLMTKAQAKAFVKQHNIRGKYYNFYHCPHCNTYHVGHLPREQQRDKLGRRLT